MVNVTADTVVSFGWFVRFAATLTANVSYNFKKVNYPRPFLDSILRFDFHASDMRFLYEYVSRKCVSL